MISIVFAVCFACAWAVPVNEPSFVTPQEYFSQTEHAGERIVGGSAAQVAQFPWQVAIYYSTSAGNYFCGGSLISDRWVLTAAHCTTGAVTFTLYLGGVTLDAWEDGRLTITTTEKIVHEGYSSTTLNNDIALLHLPYSVPLSTRISTVKLPSRADVTGANVPVTVSGWGRTGDDVSGVSNILNYVELTSITNALCSAVYGSNVVIESTICAVGNPYQSTCNGDSGGPLVDYDVQGEAIQIGVVSFVHRSGCASGNPSGYVRTASFLSWIHDNTGITID